jgi:hypothetical protein
MRKQKLPLQTLQNKFIEDVSRFPEVKEVVTTEEFVRHLPRSAAYSPYDVLVHFHDPVEISEEEFLEKLLDSGVEFHRITGMTRHDGNNNYYAYVSLEKNPFKR